MRTSNHYKGLLLLFLLLLWAGGAGADEKQNDNPYSAPATVDIVPQINKLAEDASTYPPGFKAPLGIGAVMGFFLGYAWGDFAAPEYFVAKVASGLCWAAAGCIAPTFLPLGVWDSWEDFLKSKSPLSPQNRLHKLLLTAKNQGITLHRDELTLISSRMPNAECEAALRELIEK